jgi:G:T-mismatch repair DNA endonuclease (very short patch repair protein)
MRYPTIRFALWRISSLFENAGWRVLTSWECEITLRLIVQMKSRFSEIAKWIEVERSSALRTNEPPPE